MRAGGKVSTVQGSATKLLSTAHTTISPSRDFRFASNTGLQNQSNVGRTASEFRRLCTGSKRYIKRHAAFWATSRQAMALLHLALLPLVAAVGQPFGGRDRKDVAGGLHACSATLPLTAKTGQRILSRRKDPTCSVQSSEAR